MTDAEKYDNYIKLEKIGIGGGGNPIYLVKDLTSNETLALKKIIINKDCPEEMNSCMNEIQIFKQLKHPYLLEYKDSFIRKNKICIVMEYADEKDLETKIKKYKSENSKIPEDEIWKYLLQILSGISYLHSNKIIHRDIKSQNILLSKGNVKIGDFGTSKKMDNTNAFTNTSLGTPYYLSPEICKGESYNFKSDNWMIGCVLFQLMTLDLPFKGINLPNLMKSIINDNVPNITINYSDELKNICYNLLKKKMKERISIKDIVSKNFVKEKIKNLNIYFDNNNNYNIMNISNFNNYYFSRKETVEDKSINIINDFTPIDLIRQSKSHINENNKKKKFNDNSLTIPEISINYSNSDNFTGPETPKIKEKEKKRKKSIISNYSLTKNMYLNYNNNVNRGVSPNKFSVNNLKNDYSHSPNKRDKQIVLEGSFEEDDEKMKKNKLNK